MQSSDLIGIWKLEARAGRQPADLGFKFLVKEFKEDGRFLEAGERLSQFQGLLPVSTYRSQGTWKMENDILEISGDGESSSASVVITGDVLEMAYIYPEGDRRNVDKIIVRHKRVTAG